RSRPAFGRTLRERWTSPTSKARASAFARASRGRPRWATASPRPCSDARAGAHMTPRRGGGNDGDDAAADRRPGLAGVSVRQPPRPREAVREPGLGAGTAAPVLLAHPAAARLPPRDRAPL